MSALRISRAESRRIDHQLEREDVAHAEEIMDHAVRSYRSGRFGRLRVRAAPKLPTKNRVNGIGSGWRYLLLLRILVDTTVLTGSEILIAPLALSVLAFVPFVIKGGERGPYGFWILASFLHLASDVLYARWTSASLSLFVMFCCLCGARTGSSSAS